jgi:hypothetical protein
VLQAQRNLKPPSRVRRSRRLECLGRSSPPAGSWMNRGSAPGGRQGWPFSRVRSQLEWSYPGLVESRTLGDSGLVFWIDLRIIADYCCQ